MPGMVKTCANCGATGQYGEFCDECGVPLPAAAAPALASVRYAARGAETAPAGEAVREVGAVPEPEQAPAAAGEPPGDRGVSDTPDLPAPPPAGQAERRERAKALIVPVSDPAVAAASPASPVLPGRPEPARPSVVQLPEADEVTTGRPCPWCSALNPVDRHFCRRCGLLLAGPPAAPARLPWWRRLLDWWRRPVPYAGQRPRLRRGPGQLIRWAAALVAAGVVAVAASVWGGTAVADVEDHFAHRVIVFAGTFTASRSDPGHPIANIHDGFNNTFWGTGETGDGAGVQVDAAFAQPVNLLDVVITPGAGVSQDTFTAQSRPQTLEVTLTSAGGTSTSTTFTLPDSPGPETLRVRGNDITGVTFTIESAYLSSASTQTEVAIAEIEFFAKS